MREGPLGVGDQAQALNHCELLQLRAVVVSAAGKGGTRFRQVRSGDRCRAHGAPTLLAPQLGARHRHQSLLRFDICELIHKRTLYIPSVARQRVNVTMPCPARSSPSASRSISAARQRRARVRPTAASSSVTVMGRIKLPLTCSSCSLQFRNPTVV